MLSRMISATVVGFLSKVLLVVVTANMAIVSVAKSAVDVESKTQSYFRSISPTTQLYSETSSQQDHWVSELKLMVETKPVNFASLYGGLVVDRDWNRTAEKSFSQSFVAPTLGARSASFFGFSLFAEYRFLILEKGPQDEAATGSQPEVKNISEGRVGLTFFSLLESRKFGPSRLFNETYSDLVEIPRLSPRPVLTIWNKSGVSLAATESIHFDTYAEGYAAESPNLDLGSDRRELRLGERIRGRVGPVSAALIGFYSFPWANEQRFKGWNALLVFGGSFQ